MYFTESHSIPKLQQLTHGLLLDKKDQEKSQSLVLTLVANSPSGTTLHQSCFYYYRNIEKSHLKLEVYICA